MEKAIFSIKTLLIKGFSSFLLLFIFSISSFAQSPEKISYQAVIRNASDQLVSNTNVGIQISVLQGSTSGTPVFVEHHFPTTNINGLVSLEIGDGTLVSGDLSTIDWANGPYFLKAETDLNGGSTYTISGTTQLLSVPYALHARTADSVSGGINETDPLFNASIAAGITGTDTAYWNNKLDFELDGSTTNELQVLSISNDTIYLSDGGYAKLPAGFDGDWSSLTGTPPNVSTFTNDAGYISTELDDDPNNEIQVISISNDTIYLTNGGFAVLPAGFDGDYYSLTNKPDFTNWDTDVTDDFDGQYSSLAGVPTNVSAFVNDAGYINLEGDADPNNELQILSIGNDTIYLTDGGYVVLPPGFDGDYNSLTNRPDFTNWDTDVTDDFNGDYYSLTNQPDFTNWDTDVTDDFDGQYSSLSGAPTNVSVFVNDAGYLTFENDGSPANEIQVLSISNDTIFLSDGGYVKLPASSATTYISDADGDTKVQTEESADEDIVRVDLAGTEKWVFTGSRIEPANSGSSVFIGFEAGQNDNLSDNRNVFIGHQSGKNTTGGLNTAMGYGSLFSTGGTNNSAFGYMAMYSNTTGHTNVAIGREALYTNTTGYRNVAVGVSALWVNTSGNNNVAIGDGALIDNSTGSENTALGSGTMMFNTTGSCNIAVGNFSLFNNKTGFSNVAIGTGSLSASIDKNNLVAIGDSSMYNNGFGATLFTEAIQNTAVGSKSLYANTTGSDNTAIGDKTLYSNTDGYYNTAAGSNALYSNTSGNYNTATGNQALNSNTTGNYNTGSGNFALQGNTSGSDNTAIGYYALVSNSSGLDNTAVGSSTLYNSTGSSNTAIGFKTLSSNTTGYSNTAIGTSSLYKNTTRSNLVAIGDSALYNNGTGATLSHHATGNTAVGSKTLYANTTGSGNTAIGYQTLYSNSLGNANIATGGYSLFSNTSGSSNCAYGVSTLYYNTTGSNNVAVGEFTLNSNSTGIGNTAIGYWACINNSTDNYNTAIGYSSFFTAGYSNSTALGANCVVTASNQVRLGDASVTSIGGYVNWTNVSDARFKENIHDDIPGLDFIMLLEPVTYNLNTDKIEDFLGLPDSVKTKKSSNKDDIRYSGFIAQDVEVAATSIGYNFSGIEIPEDQKSHYGLRYAEFVVPLVKATQEQQEIIEEQDRVNEEQQETIDQQQVTINNLLERIEALEEQMNQ